MEAYYDAEYDTVYLQTERQKQAQMLRSNGLTFKQVAMLMGISGPAVFYLCHPNKRREANRKAWRTKHNENFINSGLTNETNHVKGALGEPSGGASLPTSDDPSLGSETAQVPSGDSPIPR